ncbi:hypothetical protein [Actinacidiphila glaucinigra]
MRSITNGVESQARVMSAVPAFFQKVVDPWGALPAARARALSHEPPNRTMARTSAARWSGTRDS